MIQWIPRELRTSDLGLYAEAAHPEFRVYVPDEIAKGRNIYSFHRQVDVVKRGFMSINSVVVGKRFVPCTQEKTV